MSRSLILFTVLSFILCQAALGGTNHNAKIALHAKFYTSKQHCGNLPVIDECADIVTTYGTCGSYVSVFVVVYDYVGTLRGVEFGLTWPAGWGPAVTTHCGDAAVGSIVNPGDGMAITWGECTSGGGYWPVAWVTLAPTGPGDIDLIPNPATSFIGITDCDSVEYAAVAVYGAGLCGNPGDDPCINRTWYIDPYGTGDAPTIQAGIDTAVAGDTVLVAAGTYIGEGNRALRIQDKNIVLRSESGPDSTVIDAEYQDGTVLAVWGVTPATLVDGFTIRHGAAYECGGMWSSDAPRVSNCIFEDCQGSWGGALFLEDSYAEFTDCLFFSNGFAPRQVRIFGGSPSLRRCDFDSDGHYRGALYCDSTFASISDCRFYDSSDTSVIVIGAAVSCRFHAQPTFDSCTFWGIVMAGDLPILSCTDASAPIITNCTFRGNSAPTSAVIHSKEGSQPFIENTVIASSPEGQAVYCEDAGSVPTLICCDLYGNSGGDWVGFIADQYGVKGNISEDPEFCRPDSADFHVYDTSPCVTDLACGQIGAWGVGCEAAGVPRDKAGPLAFGVLANRPNPFKPATQLIFSLPEREHVTLTLYDASGRRVAVLADSRYEAGIHEVTWDGRGGSGQALTPGVYFCRLKAGRQVANRKIVLTK
jgi:hypothetical protein